MPDGASGTPAAKTEYRDLPIIDLGQFLKSGGNEPGTLPEEIRHACENIGFFFIVNHGVSEDLLKRIFEQTEAFHDLPLDAKTALNINMNQRGYIAPKATMVRHSTYNENNKFDTNATMVFATEYPEDNPHRQAGKWFYDGNQWPDGLPGFTETVREYMATLTSLGKSMLPLWARALDLEPGFFDPYFENNYTYFRMAHYPPVPDLEENEFGLGPHADTGFMTFLPQADVDGLEILDVDGKWFRPPQMHDAILVNTGQFLERWSNDRFRATPHRVIPPKEVDRYSIALFVNSAFEPVCECLPTCTGPDNPPKYPTQSYYDFYLWYMQNTYPHYGGFEEELADRDKTDITR